MCDKTLCNACGLTWSVRGALPAARYRMFFDQEKPTASSSQQQQQQQQIEEPQQPTEQQNSETHQ